MEPSDQTATTAARTETDRSETTGGSTPASRAGAPDAYRGYRHNRRCHVRKEPSKLPLRVAPSRSLQTHSRSFEWGYAGSGPAQLALAILLDYTGDEDLALRCYQRFCLRVISEFPDTGSWRLTASTIETAIETIQTDLNDA